MQTVVVFKFIKGEARTMKISMGAVEVAKRKGWNMGPEATKAYESWIKEGKR